MHENTPADTLRSLAAFPAGSNGEFNLPPALSMVIARGSGCELWDTTGKHYLDFSMGWGSAFVGHAHPEVTEAVLRQAPLGSNFAYVNANALELAEQIIALSPACDRLRFCASGTEATMYCQRLARAFTGKPQILKFEGAYHGANEIGVTSLFPTQRLDFPTPEPSSAGIAELVADSVLIAPFNDMDTTAAILKKHQATLAAVIVEPLHRCLPPEPGFLAALRAHCDELGILLIFDEVVTGFRLALGGAQEYYGVVPDLVAYGKALGGGYPIGAFGGRAAILDLVREDRINRETYVWTASTLGGNPICTGAALAALGVFRDPAVYPRMHALGAHFRHGLQAVLERHGHTACVIGDGPLAQFVFAPGPLRNYRDVAASDSAKSRAIMLALFERGIFLNPMGTKLYLSLAHTESHCKAFLEHFDAVLEALQGVPAH